MQRRADVRTMAGALGLALVAVGGVQPPGLAAPAVQQARIRPPATVTCGPDQLSAATGVVTSYVRGADRTVLRIDTDWNTREEVTIEHRGAADPSAWYLVRGEKFTAADWARIEGAGRQLQPGTRATAWLCDGGPNPIVDWLAAEEPRPGR
ncbi:MAG: hypothetical protein HY701_04290 [Gemmatimonadetes bacterium]|nr:hypothetical protein [Gemmatimonadota bacterium]